MSHPACLNDRGLCIALLHACAHFSCYTNTLTTTLLSSVQAVLPLGDYVKRLAIIFGFFFVFVGKFWHNCAPLPAAVRGGSSDDILCCCSAGAPIADQTFDFSKTVNALVTMQE
jgi:hypothetical protein